MDYEEILMVKISWYYYIEGKTQQMISDMLGISRMRVIKLLDKAREMKIVQFKIRPDSARHMELEKKIMDKYNLKDVYLVPSLSDNINETVARAAALYISERAQKRSFINIGYGDTISRTLRNLSFSADSEISLVSLTGGVSHYVSVMDPSARNSNFYIIPAPFIASSGEMAKAIIDEPSVNEILNMNKHANMTVVGIGCMTDTATVVKDGKLTGNDLVVLEMSGAVGDVLGHFIDKNGNQIDAPIHDRLISTPLDNLKEFDNVIAVAGGYEKRCAINAVLKTKIIDVLIADEDTAEALLKIKD